MLERNSGGQNCKCNHPQMSFCSNSKSLWLLRDVSSFTLEKNTDTDTSPIVGFFLHAFLWLAKHFSPTHSDSSVHTINCYTSFHIQYFFCTCRINTNSSTYLKFPIIFSSHSKGSVSLTFLKPRNPCCSLLTWNGAGSSCNGASRGTSDKKNMVDELTEVSKSHRTTPPRISHGHLHVKLPSNSDDLKPTQVTGLRSFPAIFFEGSCSKAKCRKLSNNWSFWKDSNKKNGM